MNYYKLPAELRDAIMDYLRTQPYGQVSEGMKAMEALEPIEEASPKLEAVKEG